MTDVRPVNVTHPGVALEDTPCLGDDTEKALTANAAMMMSLV